MRGRNGLGEVTESTNGHKVGVISEVHLGWEFCFSEDSYQVLRVGFRDCDIQKYGQCRKLLMAKQDGCCCTQPDFRFG